jgi:phosphate transport system substrate-binding protein
MKLKGNEKMALRSRWITYLVLFCLLTASACLITQTNPVYKSHALASGTNVIQIRGSDTVVPFAQLTAEAYMTEVSQTVVVNGGGTGHGIKSIIDDTADIGMASSTMSEDLGSLVRERDVKMQRFVVGRDALAVFVHPENPVSNLTIEQVRKIYKGDIQNWSEVGGLDLEINVSSHDPSQGTYEVWREKVMGMTSFLTKKTKILSSGSMQSFVASNKAAIGYISTLSLSNSVKVVPINGIKPDADNVKSGAYPIHRDLELYIREDRVELTKQFMAYILDPQKGQKIAQSLGIIPMPAK